jgi:hypothetical protein
MYMMLENTHVHDACLHGCVWTDIRACTDFQEGGDLDDLKCGEALLRIMQWLASFPFNHLGVQVNNVFVCTCMYFWTYLCVYVDAMACHLPIQPPRGAGKQRMCEQTYAFLYFSVRTCYAMACHLPIQPSRGAGKHNECVCKRMHYCTFLNVCIFVLFCAYMLMQWLATFPFNRR